MKSLVLCWFLIAHISSFSVGNGISDSTDCVISLGEDETPVIVRTGQSDFLYPKVGETSLAVASGDSVDLVCPGNYVIAGSDSYNNFTTATCVSDGTLKINGKNIEWMSIQCSSKASKSAWFTGNTCENDGKEAEIGFEVEDRFLRTILLCFDETRQQAFYAHSTIPASINQRNEKIPRPNWVQGSGIFDISSVNNHYTRESQRKTINTALGLSETSTKYIRDDDNMFLSRGHMTAKADGFYPAQQNTSFFLPNIAPQWQTCNDANYQQVEIYVRDYAEAHKVDLLEWTGVYGVTTLPHEETGEAVGLYLYNEDGRKALPVPEFYWKVAYEQISQKGMVFIVINNPYLSSYTPICDDVSSKVEGIKWEKDNQQKGFGYICSVDSFRKVVTYLPQFVVKGLLL